jgi:hypothetical protein
MEKLLLTSIELYRERNGIEMTREILRHISPTEEPAPVLKTPKPVQKLTDKPRTAWADLDSSDDNVE